MRGWIGGVLAAGALLAGATQAGAAPSIEFRNIIARVVIIPEDRQDISVVILKDEARRPLKVRQWPGGRVVVDGGFMSGLFGGITNCSMRSGQPVVTVMGVGEFSYDDMAQVVVRTPRDIKVVGGGAVFGFVGGTDSLDLTSAGCGDWTVGNVRGQLQVTDAGSGNVHVGTAGQAHLQVAGSGDMTTRAIAGGVDVDVGGSGEVKVEQVSGPVRIRVGGSGDVEIAGGHAPSLDVLVAGSGDVVFKGVADSFEGTVAGSGNVSVAKVTGPVKRSIAGSGDIDIGH
jgi:hypothetical protein